MDFLYWSLHENGDDLHHYSSFDGKMIRIYREPAMKLYVEDRSRYFLKPKDPKTKTSKLGTLIPMIKCLMKSP